jgi:hypothetical protein
MNRHLTNLPYSQLIRGVKQGFCKDDRNKEKQGKYQKGGTGGTTSEVERQSRKR